MNDAHDEPDAKNADADRADHDQLEAWLRGELDDEAERRFLAAAGADPALRDEVEAYGAILDAVRSLPREIEPERDLWPGIAARLAPAGRGRPPRWLAAAAVAALMLAAGLTLLWRQPGPTTPAQLPMAEVAAAVPTAPPRPAPALAAYAETDAALAPIRDQLRREIESRSGDLTPEVRAIIFENLDTIDRAIAEIEAALAERPDNPELARAYIGYRFRQVHALRRANQAAARL